MPDWTVPADEHSENVQVGNLPLGVFAGLHETQFCPELLPLCIGRDMNSTKQTTCVRSCSCPDRHKCHKMAKLPGHTLHNVQVPYQILSVEACDVQIPLAQVPPLLDGGPLGARQLRQAIKQTQPGSRPPLCTHTETLAYLPAP